MLTLDDVTLVIPTKGRPDKVWNIVSTVPHRPLLFVVNAGREALDLPNELRGAGVLSVPECRGAVHALESGFLAAKTKLVCLICDDVSFVDDGIFWLREALRVYNEKLGDRDGVVALEDGTDAPMTAAFALLSREFYLRNCYPSPYTSYFVDPEWT
jgi:hypothetical protein